MGYCSVRDFESVLAQTLTTGSPDPATLNVPGKLSSLGTQLNLTPTSGPLGPSVATYNLSDIHFYIRQAESHIDAGLSGQYEVPLMPRVSFKMKLLADMDEYSDFAILSRAFNLIVGDQVVFIQHGYEEIVEVSHIHGDVVTFEQPLMNIYTTADKILMIKFPDPIPYICARLACAMFYDKWARAQVEPMKTEYGDMLRKEAIRELNNIREGRTILDAPRTGHGFVNPNLIKRYGLKALDEQDGSRSDNGGGS